MENKDTTNLSQEQELQQSLMYLEHMKEQVETLREQLEILELATREHNQAVETLKDFKTLKNDNELLIPIGADSMVFAKILDTSKVIINIGAGIAIEESIANAIKKLSSRIEKIEANKNKIDTTIVNLQEQVIALSTSIEEKYRELQLNQGAKDKLGQPNVS